MNKLPNIKDSEILEMLSNDKLFDKGFECLVNKYQERLYWHIRKMVHFHEDADDVIQNTFLKIFKNIKGYKSQSKLFTWMYRIATNETINYLNKNKKHLHQSNGEQLNEFENKLKSDKFFDGDNAQILLAKGIELLPEKQKQVFIMRYYDDLSYKDISEILNVTVGSLKASFHHAMKKIETYLKENVSYV